MTSYVVDTNVPVVANRQAPQAGEECVICCIGALEEVKESGRVVLDDGSVILTEYMERLCLAGQPGLGDAFFKWVWQHQAVPSRCSRVPVKQTARDPDDFDEFPKDPALGRFDPSDRKFVAVALAHPDRPEILNAVDSDWWEFREPLGQHGVRIKFLCPEQFYYTHSNAGRP